MESIPIAPNPFSPSAHMQSSPPMVVTAGSPMRLPPQTDALDPNSTPSPLGTSIVSPIFQSPNLYMQSPCPRNRPTPTMQSPRPMIFPIPTMQSPHPMSFQWRIYPCPPPTTRPTLEQMFTSPMQQSAPQMFALPMQTYPQFFTSPNQQASPGPPMQQSARQIPFPMRQAVDINVVLQKIDKIIRSKNLTVTNWSGHKRLVTTIPTKSNQTQFNQWANSTSGFSDIVDHLSNSKIDESGNPIAVSFIAKHIAKKYPHVYTNVGNNTNTLPRMTAVETAAMIADARVSTGAVMDKIQRHVSLHLGSSPFCTPKQLASLTESRPVPSIRRVDINGKHADDKVESVYLRNHDIPSLFQAKLTGYLTQRLGLSKLRPNQSRKPLYGYRTPRYEKAVYVLIGTDHGQGACQSMARLLLGDSKSRKKKNCVAHETITVTFSTVKCKTDNKDIISLTCDIVNEAIDVFSKSQLVAVKDNSDKIATFFVPSEAIGFHIEAGCLQYQLPDNRSERHAIPNELGDNLKYFIVAPRLHVLMVGDLSAQMCLQGRSGMSTTRCIKCRSTWSEWNRSLNQMEHIPLHFEDLLTGKDPQIGLSSAPLWNICPQDCMLPVLHCQLGTVNYQIFEKLWPYLLSIDSTTVNEQNKTIALAQKKVELSEKLTELPLLETSVKRQLLHLKEQRQHLTSQRNILNRRLAYAERIGAETDELETELAPILASLRHNDQLTSAAKSQIVVARALIADLRKNVSRLKKEISTFVKARSKKERSIDNLADKILIHHGVGIDKYHGGTLVGPNIQKLFKNADAIFDALTELGIERIRQRRNDDTELMPPSVEDFKRKMMLHRKLIKMQDSVYAGLRMISPSKRECTSVKTDIDAMDHLWKVLVFSLTPKAHMVFSHAHEQMVRFDGLGDKTEDFIEKRHQDQKTYDMITHRQHHPTQQLATQDVLEWRNDNPLVQQRIAEVRTHTKRVTGVRAKGPAGHRKSWKRQARRAVRKELM